jgi:hypothetical protein
MKTENSIYSIFLKMNPWVLFIVLGLLPAILNVYQGKIEGTFNSAVIGLSVSVLFAFAVLWLRSIGMGLLTALPNELQMKTGLFTMATSLLFTLCLGAAVYQLILLTGLRTTSPFGMESLGTSIEWIILALSIPCLIYAAYFSARVFRTAELQRTVTFEDSMAAFFLLLFFYVGMLVLQPRIRQLLKHEEELQMAS